MLLRETVGKRLGAENGGLGRHAIGDILMPFEPDPGWEQFAKADQARQKAEIMAMRRPPPPQEDDGPDPNEEVEVEEVVASTLKAFLFRIDGKEYWFPRSQLIGQKIAKGDCDIRVSIPAWLCREKLFSK